MTEAAVDPLADKKTRLEHLWAGEKPPASQKGRKSKYPPGHQCYVRVSDEKDGRRKSRRQFNNIDHMKALSEEEKAWLAGLLDCGKLKLIIHETYKMNNSKKYQFLYAVIEVMSTNLKFMEELSRLTGCKIIENVYGQFKNKLNLWKTKRTRIQGRNLKNLLLAVKPYIVGKKVLADAFLDFLTRSNEMSYGEKNMLRMKIRIMDANYIQEDNSEQLKLWMPHIRNKYLDGYNLQSNYTKEKKVLINSKQAEEIGDLLFGTM